MKNLSSRQQAILQLFAEHSSLSNGQLLELLKEYGEHVSRITLVRDLNTLVLHRLVAKEGQGRGVRYVSVGHQLLSSIDVERYFEKETDERQVYAERVSFSKVAEWKDLLSAEEKKLLEESTKGWRKRMANYNPSALRKELERITIEFSWKSSQIEGNTYSLLETERLITQQIESKGRSKEEAIMILNHKKAFEYFWKKTSGYQQLRRKEIEDLHALLVGGLKITTGIRKHGVGITGTTYKPLSTVYQLREQLEDLCQLVNRIKNPFEKALIAVVGISYLQPFGDGNKRTARMVGNALLAAWKCCPLSYRSVNEIDYKKATIIFYEQHSLSAFKKLFLEQAYFAMGNYFP